MTDTKKKSRATGPAKKQAKRKQNVVAIIAVRMSSTRLHAKCLARIEGKPIVGHLIDIFRKVPEIDSVVLATSGKKENLGFVGYAKKLGLYCYVDKGHDEEDVLGRTIRAADIVGADQIVRGTSEGPIRMQNIGEVIKRHLKTGSDLTFIEKLPGGTNVEIVSLDALKRGYAMGKRYHCSAITKSMFENPKKFKIDIITPPKKFQRPELDLDVDTPVNLFAVREIFENVKRDKNGFIDVEATLDYLADKPLLVKMLQEGRNPVEGRIWP